ncbi:MAG: hypothetical protein J7604_01830 [Sporocytophaga sp.]|uniref:hypothetical protein n=1 Tax=Sporocytophaga sp. TaxID=2231183 RepID=UPI001B29A9E9|nr:hypothetical protein [Sporocytophaga sp.]MBO9698914.1 hypothetical protein [Sporocytophaga sp.]
MWKANTISYYLSAFIIFFSSCSSDTQKEKPNKDSLEQKKIQDTLKIDEPMQAYLEIK